MDETVEVAENWREREQKRFDDKKIFHVPWYKENFWTKSEIAQTHLPHWTAEIRNMISFTPSDEKGIVDRKTSMKPHRYIQKYLKQVILDYIESDAHNFNDYWLSRNKGIAYDDQLSQPTNSKDVKLDDEINLWADRFAFTSEPVELLHAMNRDHIRWVYEHCSSEATSCMTGEARHFESCPVHPTEVYGTGRISIAHILNDKGYVVARAVTNFTKKKYGRIYGKHGTEDRLRQALIEAGFVDGGRSVLVGKWLLKIPLRNHSWAEWVAPYLDGEDGVDDYNSKYLKVTYEGEGDYRANSQHGVLDDGDGLYCESCDESFRGESYSPGGYTICEPCYNEYWTVCYNCEDDIHNEDARYLEQNGENYCNHCWDDNVFYCADCACDTLIEDRGGTKEDGELVCDDCSEEYVESECGVLVKAKQYTITVAECECCEPKEHQREEA